MPCVFRVPMRMGQTCVPTYGLVVVVCVGLDTGGGLSWLLSSWMLRSTHPTRAGTGTGRPADRPWRTRRLCIGAHACNVGRGQIGSAPRVVASISSVDGRPRERRRGQTRASLPSSLPRPRLFPSRQLLPLSVGLDRNVAAAREASWRVLRVWAGLRRGPVSKPGMYRNHHNRLQSTHF